MEVGTKFRVALSWHCFFYSGGLGVVIYKGLCNKYGRNL